MKKFLATAAVVVAIATPALAEEVDQDTKIAICMKIGKERVKPNISSGEEAAFKASFTNKCLDVIDDFVAKNPEADDDAVKRLGDLVLKEGGFK
jgi:hypothetical protein